MVRNSTIKDSFGICITKYYSVWSKLQVVKNCEWSNFTPSSRWSKTTRSRTATRLGNASLNSTPYRGTSLIRNTPSPQDHHRSLDIGLL